MDPELLQRLLPISLGATVGLVAFLLTLVSVPYVIDWADRMGLVDIPDTRRVHSAVTPRAGGICVYLGIQSATFLVFLLAPVFSGQSIQIEWWLGVFAGSSIVFMTGLLDDLIGLKARGKLTGQMLATVLVFSAGVRLHAIGGYELGFFQDLVLTTLWFILIVNAFNLIDGIDGLASGLVGIASLGIAGFLIQRNLALEACILFAVVGSCAGFLIYNRHPASIFLGDSGSNLLGFMIATMMLSTGSKAVTVGYLWLPLLAIIVPALDLVLAIWRRLGRWIIDRLEGHPSKMQIMSGDLQHLHHRLLRLNIHPRDVAATLYLINAIFVLGGLMAFPYKYPGWGLLFVATIIAIFLAKRFVIGDEIESSMRIIFSLLITPKKRRLTLILFLIADISLIILSLFISVKITHPDFPIPVAIHRSLELILYWSPIGIYLIYILEREALRRFEIFRPSISNLLLFVITVSLCALGVHTLMESVTITRVMLNLTIFVAMSFLFLVSSRVLLTIVERTILYNKKDRPLIQQNIKPRGLKSIRFYARVI